MRILLFSVFLFTSAISSAQEFSIDSWDFDWRVETSGDTRLILRKNADAIVVMLREDFKGVDLAPEDAEAIGKILQKTADYAKTLKGTKSKNETVNAGKYKIEFWTGETGSFFVTVGREGAFALSTITLTREQSIDFAPHLSKARAMATHLDKMVDPAAPKKPTDPALVRKAAELAKADADRIKAEADKTAALAAQTKAEADLAKVEAEKTEFKLSAAKAKEELEMIASKKLALAKSIISKEKTAGKKRLQEIVDKFDGTSAAEEAVQLLKKLQ